VSKAQDSTSYGLILLFWQDAANVAAPCHYESWTRETETESIAVRGRMALTFKAARGAYQLHHNVGRRTRRGDKLVFAMIVA
jgi:hypothetical protein